MPEYYQRIADKQLAFKLKSKGAVLIEGSKWCGKTTTAEQQAKSILYLSEPASRAQNLAIAELEPQKLLDGSTPRLLDEWQIAPSLWDAVRFEVDHRKKMGQFILTGSAVPADREQIFHSGTGRFSWLKMRPMSLYESRESNGKVRLGNLFAGKKFTVVENELSKLDDLAFVACRGGWPASIGLSRKIALAQAFDYVDATVNDDISRVDNIQRDSERTRRIMRSYARLQGSQAPVETIVADASEADTVNISRDTIANYLDALRKIFVIEDLAAWNPNLRSKTAIRTSDTRYFVDPSIATAVLGLEPEMLISDLNLFGFIFETLCIRDLRVYADSLDAKVYHYRDRRGLECDAVIALRNGDYGLAEIKLGGESAIQEGAENLNNLAADLKKSPKFKMIITGTGDFAYVREDGIYVVPIGCLAS